MTSTEFPSLEDDITLALQLAEMADALTLPRYQALDLQVEQKSDLTPVTEADRAAELALREALADFRPDDGVVGEEFGSTDGTTGRVWIIDPIDGTMNFVRGIPVWATLIAMTDGRQPVVGVVSAPALQRRWWSALGRGAYVNGEPIEVSTVGRLGDAQVSLNALRDFELHGGYDAMRQLTREVWRVRGFGDFWSHMLVAEGAVDIAVEAIVKPWDVAAVQAIVQEAGGRFSDLQGAPDHTTGSALSTNGLLHELVLERFASAQEEPVP